VTARAPRTLTIASRGSPLAIVQAELVARPLRSAYPSLEIVLVTVTTTGDSDRRPFRHIGGKGLFVAEVERAVIEGRADVAVHSAKDLTAELDEAAVIVCVPERASPADVVVGGTGSSGEERLASLAPAAVVGTSSARRRALIAEARPDLDVADLRGNLGTRLDRVADGGMDAAVVAAAGLERLAPENSPPWSELDPTWWVPAPAQGALAVEARADREDLAELFGPLDDFVARAEIVTERSFSRRLEGGCSVPLGCLARAEASGLVATGYVGAPDGSSALRDRTSGPLESAVALGTELAEALLAAGADDILADISSAPAAEVDPP
jgi:hydroxymethylbilane synthase